MTVKSGYLNNPPKVIVIEDDNRPGSYPGLSSPGDIARSPESNRPYRDDVVPLSKSPYATGKINFLRDTPLPATTITIISSSGKISVFTFTRAMVTTSAYDINMSELPRGGTLATSESIRVANQVADIFVRAVSRVPECEITAEKGLSPGEVILRQTIPGSAGNTNIATTVSSARMSVESFSGGSNTEIRYPYGMVISDTDSQTSEVIRRFIKSERSGTLSAPGDPDPMRFTAPADQHPYTLHRPYDESNSQQSFGVPGGSDLYGSQTELYSNFFTRGSVPGSLDEPLRSKDKIEIDLTPTITTTLKYTNTASIPTYGMAYYNFSQRRWEGAGTGYSSIDAYTLGGSNSLASFDAFHAGFSQSCFMGYPATESGWASCTDTFGFPVHPKYHATSSQTLGVSSLVDRPFIVEKIVYEFSASSGGSARILPGNHPIATGNKMINNCGGTFFILNQRVANPDPGQDTSYTSYYYANLSGDSHASPGWTGIIDDQPPLGDIYTSSLPVNRVISRGGLPVYVNTVRDLVTFARVGAVWSNYDSEIVQNLDSPGDDHPAKFMDLAIEVPNSGTYDGHFTVASDVKTPQFNNTLSIYSVTNNLRVFTSKQSNTRNSLDLPTGRALRSEYCSSLPLKTKVGVGGNADQVVTFYESDTVSSPYVILPGDSLVFGWQAPVSFSHLYDGESFSIGPGKGKLTLYGSYLQDDKPIHDIYKDQLISDSVHEVIPAGPAVLDQFDTEPTMVFSGSMREEYIRGEMFERRSTWYGDTSLIPISVDSKKVRKVRGRASDGNLGQRSSFSRNTKVFQLDEQYYDSMQLDPVKVLMNYSGSTALSLRFANSINYVFLGAPGESYNGSAFIEAASNRKFIGSFAFEPNLYNGIERVRNINSLSFSNAKVTSIDFTTGAPRPNQKIDVIGYVTGSSLLSSVSSLIRPGGLMEYGISGFGLGNNGFFYPQSSPGFDTNPSDSDTGQFGVTPSPPFPAGNFDGVWNFINKELDFNGINYHLSRLLGCFGDGFMRMTQYSLNLFLPGYAWVVYDPSYVVFPAPIDLSFSPAFPSANTLYGQVYRGTRYGLINPTPLYSSCVFSGTGYGQFRDLLEQRQFTIFEREGGLDSGAPVEVVFIDRETGEPLPVGNYSGSNSINLSVYCTSSLPYFDGEVRDRGLPLPEQSIYYVPTFPSFL